MVVEPSIKDILINGTPQSAPVVFHQLGHLSQLEPLVKVTPLNQEHDDVSHFFLTLKMKAPPPYKDQNVIEHYTVYPIPEWSRY